jgi:hypothetical protein
VRSALGLAEFVTGLASIVDRDLFFQGRLTSGWLALCASSRCSRALRFAVSRAGTDPGGFTDLCGATRVSDQIGAPNSRPSDLLIFL